MNDSKARKRTKPSKNKLEQLKARLEARLGRLAPSQMTPRIQ